jgi:hypothetical protein
MPEVPNYLEISDLEAFTVETGRYYADLGAEHMTLFLEISDQVRAPPYREDHDAYRLKLLQQVFDGLPLNRKVLEQRVLNLEIDEESIFHE